MGVKERREKQREELRQEILDAARTLFIREGYENVSMRKVAEKIEYSPTTIYLYFKSKAELLNCLCEETFAKLGARLEALAKDSPDPVEGLRKGLRVYIEFGLKNPSHYTVTFINHPLHHEGLGEEFAYEGSMGHKAFSYLSAAVGECVRQKKFRRVDVEATSQATWAAVHGLTSLLIVHPDFPWVARNKLIDSLLDTLIEGLKA
ncbi:MAG: TetR/AcrR family transcriptional regulator [Pyrinomonadaceae bacterium]|nr:TetR/AcrR family transcriptional regulator [Pyrinomonadaceae bacterium]